MSVFGFSLCRLLRHRINSSKYLNISVSYVSQTPTYKPKRNVLRKTKATYHRKIQNVLFTPWKHGQRKEGTDVGACNIMNYISHELHISRLSASGISDFPDTNFADPLVFSDLLSSGNTFHINDSNKDSTIKQQNNIQEYDHLNKVKYGDKINTKSVVMLPLEQKYKVPPEDEFEEGYADNILTDDDKRKLKLKKQELDELSPFYFDIFNQHQKINIDENVLTVGGDHSVAIGSVISSIVRFNKKYNMDKNTNKLIIPKSSRKYKMGVIWIDAHCDLNTWKKSNTKNLHGMPVSFITGLDDSFSWVNKLMGTKSLNYEDGIGRLSFSDLFYWGIRDVDNYEIKIVEDNNIGVITGDNNEDELLQLKSIVDEYDLIHCSLDIDGLDPKWCPSTGTVVSDGLDLYNVLSFLDYLMLSNKCMSMDLVEYNPLIGDIKDKMITRDSIQQILRVIF